MGWYMNQIFCMGWKYGGLEVIYNIQERFCKNIWRILTNPADGTAVWELCRVSSTGRMQCLVVKYLYRIMQMAQKVLVISCYVWQVGSLKLGSWVLNLREELDKIELGYICQNMQGRVVRSICQIITTRCNDIQTERSMSLLSYWEMKNG
jgi:hypothetical protein